jgi:hypothetical protein
MTRHANVLSTATLLLGLLFAGAAHAQPATLKHVWTVPGVLETDKLASFIFCTNASTSTQTVRVEVYGPTGALISGFPSSVPPAGTVSFGTTVPVGFPVDVNIGTGNFTGGHARVLATRGNGILCSAFLSDTTSAAPVTMTSLPVVKKVSQKGD